MKHATTLLTLAICAGGGPLAAQHADEADAVEARLWLGGGDEPVVQRGDRLPIQYRTSFDAYAAVFRIDTDGRISLLHPSSPWQDGRARGGRDHRLALERSPFWTVSDDPGVGYMFLVASTEPLDLSRFVFHPRFGWDLSSVGAFVYDDPYLAMDDFVAALVPSWQTVPYALDFVTYHVGEARSYPRFLCYDCHTARSYSDWNPYAELCPEYRIVVYDDPYYHPAYRYSGTRVVFPQPLPNRPRYALAVRGGSQSWAPIVRVRAAPARPVEFKEAPVAATPAVRPDRRPARASTRLAPTGTSRGGETPTARPAGNSAGRAGVNRPAPSRSGVTRPATGSTTRTPAATRPQRARRPDPSPAASRPARVRSRAPERRPAASRPSTGVGGAASPRRPTSAAPSRRPPPAGPPRTRARPPAATGRPAPAARPGGGSRPARATRSPPRRPEPRAGPAGGPGRSGI